MNPVKVSIMLIALFGSLQTIARDVNVIDPSELPKISSRGFSVRGRGKIPNFPENYGLENAKNDRTAESYCMAPVGRQLTDWKIRIEEGFYWLYEISAKFECLSPIVTVMLDDAKANDLSHALENITVTSLNGVLHKDAKVICYDFYEEVCNGHTLQRYRNHNVCELSNLNMPEELIKLEDVKENGTYLQNQGANKLTSLLPIYVDSRRDDSPGGNCLGHVYGKLKGLSRKAASVYCSIDGTKESCKIDGIIRPIKE